MVVIVLSYGGESIMHIVAARCKPLHHHVCEVSARGVEVKAECNILDIRMMLQKIVDWLEVEPAQRQIVNVMPWNIVFVLPQRGPGHGVDGRFINFYDVAALRVGGDQKTVLLFASCHITAKITLTTALKSRARHTVLILAHKDAVTVVAARCLIQDAVMHTITQYLRTDTTMQ